MSSKIPMLQISDRPQPKNENMKITVIGTGYVGLVSGACLAELGHDVMGYDRDPGLLEDLAEGKIRIREEGLQELIKQNVGLTSGLMFTSDLTKAIDHGNIFIIAVGTPEGEDGKADLTHVHAVAKLLGKHLSRDAVVINKSTAPVGTAEAISALISEGLVARGVELRFSVVSNPEFLSEGRAVEDFMNPSRIVVGHDQSANGLWARDLVVRMYENILHPAKQSMMKCMDIRSAELTKYAANVMLASRISFMNELAALADATGANIENIRIGIGSDPRIGPDFLRAGIGFGGSCFPKDVKALRAMSIDAGVSSYFAQAVHRINDCANEMLMNKILARFPDVRGLTFAIWGAAFKAGTNDLRESPALNFISQLLLYGATLKINDISVCSSTEACEKLEKFILGRSMHANDQFKVMAHSSTLSGADAVIVLTDWPEYAATSHSMYSRMKQRVMFDGRNIIKPTTVKAAKLEYHSIGRPSIYPK